MRLDYEDQRIIRVVAERDQALRHLHARALGEARLQAASTGRHPRPRIIDRLATTIVSRWQGREHSAPDLSRVQVTIAAAAMAVPVAATDGLPVEPTTPDLPAASVEIALEMTESTCRLMDGSIGRIAIRRHSDDDWDALCVAVTALDPSVHDPSALEAADRTSA